MLFDTHVHILDERFDKDRAELIEKLRPELKYVLEASTDEAYSKRAQKLAHDYDFIYCSAGIHPHEAKNVSKNYIDVLDALIDDEKCKAIGEIGLDYYRNHSPKDAQKRVFYEQLELAIERDIPVLIHDRDARQDVFDAIKKYDGKLRGVMHCYSGNLELAQEYMKLGFYISIAGPVTFKNARRMPEIVPEIDEDKLLAETDSPYLTPEPYRGKRNDPRKVKYVVQEIARLRNITYEKAAEITLENGKRLFNITE